MSEFNRRTVRKSDSIVEMNLLYPEDEDIAPYTFSPVDDELTVHRLVGEDGHQAALLNFGCHHGYRMLTGGGLLSIFSRLYLLRAADNFASLAVPSVVYPRCRRRCCPSQPQRGTTDSGLETS